MLSAVNQVIPANTVDHKYWPIVSDIDFLSDKIPCLHIIESEIVIASQ